MAWYWWVLLWAVLVLAAVGILGGMGLSLWRRAKLLFAELEQASERLAAVSSRLEQLSEQRGEPAIFTPAVQLRQQRFLDRRHQP